MYGNIRNLTLFSFIARDQDMDMKELAFEHPLDLLNNAHT